MSKTIVSIRGLKKSYFRANTEVPVLDGIDLEVDAGSFEALMGPSGSGKSTLLNMIAGLDKPSQGSLIVNGANLAEMSQGQLADWRAQTIGFIFQSFNLIPVLTAAENVELPLLLTKLNKQQRKERVATALKIVGLAERMDHYPRELSGGQEQRVAIARALVSDPTILVADEPTGDLDRKSAEDILDLLVTLNKDFGKTIFMVTHDPAAAERASVRRFLNKGLLEQGTGHHS